MALPMRSIATCLFATAAALAASGCASAGEYPSLARRPAERVTGTAEAVAPEPTAPSVPEPPSAELTARLAQLEDHAQAAHRRFTDRRAQAERLIANGAGAPAGSESWALASVALAELESVHSEAMLPLTELDQLHTAESIADDNAKSGNDAAITASRDRVLGLLEEEDRVLAALRGRLGN